MLSNPAFAEKRFKEFKRDRVRQRFFDLLSDVYSVCQMTTIYTPGVGVSCKLKPTEFQQQQIDFLEEKLNEYEQKAYKDLFQYNKEKEKEVETWEDLPLRRRLLEDTIEMNLTS